jgi:hypothetical protein
MATTANSGMKQVTLRGAAQAALVNEQLTRQRVEILERQAAELYATLDGHGDLVMAQRAWVRGQVEPLARGFWGRLRWLFTGK